MALPYRVGAYGFCRFREAMSSIHGVGEEFILFRVVMFAQYFVLTFLAKISFRFYFNISM